jgi:bifunctional DNA-binding transcriptional regulator/antitoxin component of YhaV-PrlF toxin-antitoxin module
MIRKGWFPMTVQSFTLQVAQRGLITLPKIVRMAYDIRPGQEMTLVDLDGVFVLSPRPSQVDPLADELAQDLAARGQSLESMLLTLREVRAESV